MNRINALFNRMFDIRPGERLRAFLMFIYIFLVITAIMIIKPVCNSLFLLKFGADRLPYAFILIAVFAVLVITLYTEMLKRSNLFQMIRLTLLIFATILGLFWLFLLLNILKGVMLYLIYVLIAIFSVISASQFWSLANILFNPREAKRLFGFIGAGAISGGIFGGYLTKLTAPGIGSENLVPLCAGCLLLCLPLISFIKRQRQSSDFSDENRPSTAEILTRERPVHLIRNNKHLLLLTGILGISVLAAKVVEYQFSAVAVANIGDPDQLTAFFGFWLSNLNIASLLVQLFITRRVVGVLGVGISLFFLPAGILIGSLFVLIYPCLPTAVILKIFDGSLKNSIQKSGLELLALPIPANIKNRTKAFIDVVMDSLATGASGLLLLVATAAFELSVRQISFITIAAGLFWIYLVSKVRYEYINAFRIKINHHEPPLIKTDLRKVTIINEYLRILKSDNEQKVLNALKLLRDFKHPDMISSFKHLIHHPSAAVKLEVLKQLYFYPSSEFLETVSQLVYDTSPDIQVEAFHYLFAQGGADRTALFQNYLNHQDKRIRAASLLCVARESRSNSTLKEQFHIRKAIESLIRNSRHAGKPGENSYYKQVCARVIGAADIPEFHDYLFILLHDTSPDVLRAAILGAGESRRKIFIPILLKYLGDTSLVLVASRALNAFGPGIIDDLSEYLDNAYVPSAARRNLPNTIAGFGVQKSADLLIQHLNQNDTAIRFGVIRALSRLRRDHPSLYFNDYKILQQIYEETREHLYTLVALYGQSLLKPSASVNDQGLTENEKQLIEIRRQIIEKLEIRLDEILERIFRLLGLKYPPQDMLSIYKGLKNSSHDIRLNAVEFLDNILDARLKKIIIPLLELVSAEALMETHFKQLGLKIPSEAEVISALLNQEDKDVRIMTLLLIDALNDDQYLPLVGAMLNSPDESVRSKALEVLGKMGFRDLR